MNSKCGKSVSTKDVTNSAIIDMFCDPPIIGRYVSLQLKGKHEYLSVCEVRVYSETDIEKTECYYDTEGLDYRGIRTTTTGGYLCHYWNTDENMAYITNNNHTTEGIGDHNFCRNPDMDETVWCFSELPEINWQICAVPDPQESCSIGELKMDRSLFFLFLFILSASSSYLSLKRSIYSETPSETLRNAVDGNDAFSNQTCYTSTSNGFEEWIKIDLDQQFNVTSITIINRVENDLDTHLRLADAELRVGNNFENFAMNRKCGASISTKDVTNSAIIDMVCDPPIIGRYVSLQLKGKHEYLSVCEVRVYSETDIEKTECYYRTNGRDYRGMRTTTVGGLLCDYWDTEYGEYFLSSSVYNTTFESTNILGVHNFCRNPDGDTTVWCVTETGWEYCAVENPGEACSIQPFSGKLLPIGLWLLDSVCDTYEDVHNLYNVGLVSRLCNEGTEIRTGGGKTPISLFISEYPSADVIGLTVAVYMYPYLQSNGPIILGYYKSTEELLIRQTPDAARNGNSQVEVYIQNHMITSANVFLPNSWTFLAVTYEKTGRLVKLWRNGEIASIGYVDLSIEFVGKLQEITLGATSQNSSGLHAKLSWLQLYDHVLNEAEMKAAMEIKPTSHQYATIFQRESSESCSEHSQQVGVVSTKSATMCAQRCIRRFMCRRFTFDKTSLICTLYVNQNTSCGYKKKK
ncbi:apolipoprotein(a)-like [Anneissia japonica]|uniref:apolipoprotein(a)-like n=1 Tax=Anneissia japonica TaxID=1529436 RepID=UPI0014256C83|nr:apolipoprotein(a)-like [Anneissia japonica]